MNQKHTLSQRYAVSIGSNFIKLLFVMLIGFILAREFGPQNFGDYSYLVAVFTALVRVIDFNVSNAFFTLSSSDKVLKNELLGNFYFQITTLILVVSILIFTPEALYTRLFHSIDLKLVVLSFIAVFVQQRGWGIVNQLSELYRATLMFQKVNLLLYFVHFCVVLTLSLKGILDLYILFFLIVLEWLVAEIFVLKALLKNGNSALGIDSSSGVRWQEYRNYCFPLIFYSVIVFFGEFFDRWMLQTFQGSEQQAYFSLAKQLSFAALAATSSILMILWREVSALFNKRELIKLSQIIDKTVILLYWGACIVSVYLAVWSYEIIFLTVGETFTAGYLAFSVMAFYPMHQVIGQIAGSVLMATQKTKAQFIFGSSFVILGAVGTYIVIGHFSDTVHGVGSVLLALKLVCVQLVSVNVLVFYIYKSIGIKLIGRAQFLLPLMFLVICLLVKSLTDSIFDNMVFRLFVSGVFYIFIVVVLTIKWPEIFGVKKDQVLYALTKINSLIRRRAE